MTPKLQSAKDGITGFVKQNFPELDFYVTLSDRQNDYASFGVESLAMRHDSFLDDQLEMDEAEMEAKMKYDMEDEDEDEYEMEDEEEIKKQEKKSRKPKKEDEEEYEEEEED